MPKKYNPAPTNTEKKNPATIYVSLGISGVAIIAKARPKKTTNATTEIINKIMYLSATFFIFRIIILLSRSLWYKLISLQKVAFLLKTESDTHAIINSNIYVIIFTFTDMKDYFLLVFILYVSNVS